MYSTLLGVSILLLIMGLVVRSIQPKITRELADTIVKLKHALQDVIVQNHIYKNNLDISMERVTELERQLEEKCNKCPNRRKK